VLLAKEIMFSSRQKLTVTSHLLMNVFLSYIRAWRLVHLTLAASNRIGVPSNLSWDIPRVKRMYVHWIESLGWRRWYRCVVVESAIYSKTKLSEMKSLHIFNYDYFILEKTVKYNSNSFRLRSFLDIIFTIPIKWLERL